MEDANAPRALSSVFAALGDVTRLQLARRLAQGEPQSIAQLAQGLNMSHQGITKHLKVMERAELVRAQKVGRERRYVGDPDKVQQACDYQRHIGDEWENALLRLLDYVEES